MLQTIVQKLKIPKLNTMIDSQLNLPRITMIGDIHVYIENHQGIIRFTSQEISLNISNGQLQIKGSDLGIKMLLTNEILIEGQIQALEMKHKSAKVEGENETA